MLRVRDGEPKECTGKYLVNANNIGLQVIVANQKNLNKADFINDFLSKVEMYLNDLLEER